MHREKTKAKGRAIPDAITAKQAQAYRAMESSVHDLAHMGAIAMDQFDKGEGRFIFAVSKLERMINEFKTRYHAEDFSGT